MMMTLRCFRGSNTRFYSFKGAKLVRFNSHESIFSDILNRRRSVRKFKMNTKIDDDTLTKMLKHSQLSPSSFNLQPYKGIVISNDEQKNLLSECMLGEGNIDRVKCAAVTIVFLADRKPTRNTQKLMKLELDANKSNEYVQSLPAKTSFLAGHTIAANKIKNIATTLLSPITGMPMLEPINAWSIKNTALACQTLMLSAAAHGYDSCPMEGYDARRMGYLLKIPLEEYSIPMIISIGEIDQEAEDKLNVDNAAVRTRFPINDVFYTNQYGDQYDK